MPDAEKAAIFEARTKEQYEAIGRFIAAYEDMVSAIRGGVISLTSTKETHLLVTVAFNHHALTAYPLWEILRSILGQMIRTGTRTSFSTAEIAQLVKDIGKEVEELIKIRNTLVHAKWFIGGTGPDPEEPYMAVFKPKGTFREGLSVTDAPRTVDEILALADRCQKHQKNITVLWSLFMGLPIPREMAFKSDGDRLVVK